MMIDPFFFVKEKYFDSLMVRLLCSEKTEVGAARIVFITSKHTLLISKSQGLGLGKCSLPGRQKPFFFFFSFLPTSFHFSTSLIYFQNVQLS